MDSIRVGRLSPKAISHRKDATMQHAQGLEELISSGLQIEFRDYLAIEEWLYNIYVALGPFPAERARLVLACSDIDAAPEEKILRGLEILTELVEHSLPFYPHHRAIPKAESERFGQFG